MKRISILGSTGSIGRQCLSVVDSLPGRFEVTAFSAGANVALVAEQISRHHPKVVSVATEEAAAAVQAKGVRVSVMRLPQVHDPLKQGLITPLIAIAREKGVSAYVGEGLNRWPAVHVRDAARVYRLALEKGSAGARYNAVGEEGVALREIAESIGRGLKLPVVSKTPEEASEHFGWLGVLVGVDIPASSTLTRERLGWHPTGVGLIADLNRAEF